MKIRPRWYYIIGGKRIGGIVARTPEMAIAGWEKKTGDTAKQIAAGGEWSYLLHILIIFIPFISFGDKL